MNKFAAAVFAVASVLAASPVLAQSASSAWPKIKLEKIAEGFRQPTHITHAGDGSGRLFVVEREGRIRLLRNGRPDPKPFLDIRKKVKSLWSEQGLLSVAFPSDFRTSGLFYIDYTSRKGVGDTVVSRVRVRADRTADAASEEMLLTVRQPYSNHNGGQLAFGPDGYLYIGLGDGGSGGDPQGNGQSRTTFLGKLLRIDVARKTGYAVPPSNPFRNEIWAYGLRNPWRFSFDRQTGDLYIADVGQHKVEEIDVQPAGSKGGENYGWNIMEGSRCFRDRTCSTAGLVLPIAEYGHEDGNCSVTGGFVYRGKRYPALEGMYVYGDFCSGTLYGLRRAGDGWQSHQLLRTEHQISTFGEDEEGNIYLADYGDGSIYRITAD